MAKSEQLSKIIQGKLWKFFGGIKPDPKKNTSDCPIEELPLPSLLTLPVNRHLGSGGQIIVKTGDYVKTGQMLTIPGGTRNVPLHAPTSGHITNIGMQVLPHPSGFLGLCISIKPDGLDEALDPMPIVNWQNESPQTLLQRIRSFGVEGLGGAQFQTATKLGAAIADGNECNIFIVNGAECEPVATCDDRLMQEKTSDIIDGIAIVKHILKPKLAIIAIEDNKPNAIAAIKKALEGRDDIATLRVIPTVYPSGAARSLIKIVTGIEIPYSAHTSDCGIVVDNVETVFAIKQAVIDGIPLTKRVVTIDGGTLMHRGNALVRLGTSVRFLLTHYKLNPERRQRIILGGPFMGFTLPTIDVPITKATTCVLAPTAEEMPLEEREHNCIRCGRCARVCPSRLVPYLMYAYSKASDHVNAKKCGIADCTECGCCSYVCPSKIRLTGQFRKEKAIQALILDKQERNIRAKERQQIRNERLAKEAQIREAKKKAALERIAKQKAAAQEPNATANVSANTNASVTPQNAGVNATASNDFDAKRAAAVAAARERAAQRRKALLEKSKANASNSQDPNANAQALASGAVLGANAKTDVVGAKANATLDANSEALNSSQDSLALSNQDTALSSQDRIATIKGARTTEKLGANTFANNNLANGVSAETKSQSQVKTQFQIQSQRQAIVANSTVDNSTQNTDRSKVIKNDLDLSLAVNIGADGTIPTTDYSEFELALKHQKESPLVDDSAIEETFDKPIRLKEQAPNLPYNLRQGSIHKQVQSIDPWPLPVARQETHTTVENPPTHEIVPARQRKYHSILGNYDLEDENTKNKVPERLKKKNLLRNSH